MNDAHYIASRQGKGFEFVLIELDAHGIQQTENSTLLPTPLMPLSGRCALLVT
ncbi:MAG: hypothetical protein ACR5K7_02055 [Symbiopectobacterium sp.]